ncbi:MAG: hypothetical protein WCF85_11195 [Rhodospirillaceae bacterium]
MDAAHQIVQRQRYCMELRNLTPVQQDVVSLWLNMIGDGETIPHENAFYETHFNLNNTEFVLTSPFCQHMRNLLVIKKVVFFDRDDWRYLFKGDELRTRIGDGERAHAISLVSEIESDLQRRLILGDLETLSIIQSPYHPRLIWRPYSGFFGSNNEHKTFIRIGMPLTGADHIVSSCIFMIVEAQFDGRAIIELT